MKESKLKLSVENQSNKYSDETSYRSYVISKIRQGREAAERGEVNSTEELKKEIKTW